MRAVLLLLSMVSACQGEPVSAVSADAASDAAFGDAASCSANLVPNGAFESGTSGWAPYNCAVDPVTGGAPCGNAVRLRDLKSYGTIARRVNRPLAQGTRLRLRGWFRADTPSGELPSVSITLYHRDDAGAEVSRQTFSARPAALEVTWNESETTYTLTEPETEFVVSVNANRPHDGGPDLYVAAISLVVE